jgi:polyisoprenoid-binding protein YceI
MRRVRSLVALAAAVSASAAGAAPWEAQPGPGNRIAVNVFKKGAFSAFAHDHHFEVTKWRVAADVPDGDPASASVEVVLSADSLQDHQERLSEGDRRKVDAQAAGPEVLDAQHHPRIEFRSQRFEPEKGGGHEHVRGTLRGTLSVRGRSAPVAVPVQADREGSEWRVRGELRVKQTAFGIKPYRGFGGGVGVKDEVQIEIALVLRPRGG